MIDSGSVGLPGDPATRGRIAGIGSAMFVMVWGKHIGRAALVIAIVVLRKRAIWGE